MEHLLASGRTTEGLEIIKELFGHLGQRLPGGRKRALLMMAWEVLRFRVRGTGFRERPESAIPAEELWKIDVLQTVGHKLAMLDPVPMSCFMHRAARWALDCGEPRRAARCLSAIAAMTALEGGVARTRAAKMIATAVELSGRVGGAFERAYAAHNRGLVSWGLGEWEEALAWLRRTEEMIAEGEVSFASFRTSHRHFILDCLMMTGRWKTYSAEVVQNLHAAHRHGDRFATSAMLVHSYLPALMSGRPKLAEEQVRQSWESWPQKGNVMGEYWGVYGRVEAAMYRGDGTDAMNIIRRERGGLNSNTHFKLALPHSW